MGQIHVDQPLQAALLWVGAEIARRQLRQGLECIVAEVEDLQLLQRVELRGQVLDAVVREQQRVQGLQVPQLRGDDLDAVAREVQVRQLGQQVDLRGLLCEQAAADVQVLQAREEADADLPLAQLLQQFQVAHLHRQRLQRVARQIQVLQAPWANDESESND